MIRRLLPLLLPLALAVLAGCMDQELLTAPAPEGPLFNHAPGHCEVNNTDDAGPGSLRAALGNTACTTITFGVTGTITLTSGQLAITRNLTITGPGANLLTVARSSAEGMPAFRIFLINPGVTATISGLTITNGNSSASGGGINNAGTLTLTNSTVSGHTATFGGGGISNSGTGTLTLNHSTVSGNTASGSGGGIVNAGSTLTLSHSTVSGNSSAAFGGGISNAGTLTLTNSTVSGNNASGSGGISNSGTGTLTLNHSTVSGNTASGSGGGMVNTGMLTLNYSTVSGNSSVSGGGGGIVNTIASTLTLNHSTVSGNTASGSGGGILNAGSTLTLSHSTVSGNSSAAFGGGIGNSGMLTLTNSTVSGNNAGTGGGISNNIAGTLTLRSSLIAGNTATIAGPDVNAVDGIATASYSLIGSPAGHTITATAENGNLVGTAAAPLDPKLGPLQDNGGATQTHALLPGSPAIDHVPVGANGCGASGAGGVTEDQRGVLRPQGSGCDIGAFELEQAPLTPAQLLEALITASASTPGVSRGTQNKLLEARHHLSQGQIGPACNKLREYIADVQSQSGKKITAADAARLIGMAEEVRSALGC